MTKFNVRYFMSDSDMKYIEDSSEQYDVFSDYTPSCVFAGSIEIACLKIKAKGWIAYPFKHEDGSFSVWAWYEGLLIRLDWEIPSTDEDGVPTYDMTFLEFSPITYKKEYTAPFDYQNMDADGVLGEPNCKAICRKITLVNRSSPII